MIIRIIWKLREIIMDMAVLIAHRVRNHSRIASQEPLVIDHEDEYVECCRNEVQVAQKADRNANAW